jgi:hypothetical protein
MTECIHCKELFKTNSSLLKHTKTAKYCLKIQGEKNNNFNCSACKKVFTSNYNLHIHTISCKAVKDSLHQKELLEKDKQIEELKICIEKQDIHIKELETKLENIAIKIGCRPTIINNNPTNNINYINKIEKLDLTTDQYIKDQVDNLTIDHIKKGCVGYAEYAIQHPFKNRIICVDYARRKIKYKDSDGNVITDPEMTRLSSKLFDSIKSRNKELTLEFLNELEPELKLQMSEDMSNQIAMVNLGAEGEKTDLYFDFIKNICSQIVV